MQSYNDKKNGINSSKNKFACRTGWERNIRMKGRDFSPSASKPKFIYLILFSSVFFTQQLWEWKGVSCRAPLTRILLSFIWIFLETSSAQWGSLRKSQKIRPTAAFTQATVSSSCSSSPLGCTWAKVVLWNWRHSRQQTLQEKNANAGVD